MIRLLFVFIFLEGDLRVLASADKPTTFLRLFQARVTRILRLLRLGLDTLALGVLGRTLVILFVQLTAPTIRALLLRELVEYAIADLVNDHLLHDNAAVGGHVRLASLLFQIREGFHLHRGLTV